MGSPRSGCVQVAIAFLGVAGTVAGTWITVQKGQLFPLADSGETGKGKEAQPVASVPSDEGMRAGRWEMVDAKGNNGTKWVGYLVLVKSDQHIGTGRFEWRGANQGKEMFSWQYDPKDRVLEIIAKTARSKKANVEPGHYKASVSADGTRIINGTWSGTSDGGGTWAAIWKEK